MLTKHCVRANCNSNSIGIHIKKHRKGVHFNNFPNAESGASVV